MVDVLFFLLLLFNNDVLIAFFISCFLHFEVIIALNPNSTQTLLIFEIIDHIVTKNCINREKSGMSTDFEGASGAGDDAASYVTQEENNENITAHAQSNSPQRLSIQQFLSKTRVTHDEEAEKYFQRYAQSVPENEAFSFRDRYMEKKRDQAADDETEKYRRRYAATMHNEEVDEEALKYQAYYSQTTDQELYYHEQRGGQYTRISDFLSRSRPRPEEEIMQEEPEQETTQVYEDAPYEDIHRYSPQLMITIDEDLEPGAVAPIPKRYQRKADFQQSLARDDVTPTDVLIKLPAQLSAARTAVRQQTHLGDNQRHDEEDAVDMLATYTGGYTYAAKNGKLRMHNTNHQQHSLRRAEEQIKNDFRQIMSVPRYSKEIIDEDPNHDYRHHQRKTSPSRTRMQSFEYVSDTAAPKSVEWIEWVPPQPQTDKKRYIVPASASRF